MRGVLVLIALALVAAPAASQDWKLSGSNEIMLESYSVGGRDDSASPFRFEGRFLTDRLNFGLGLEDETGRRILIRAEILGTNSDYFAHQEVTISTLSFELEDESAAIPYRFAAGDVQGDLSRRILQRQVRGLSLELQPSFGRGAHSLMIIAGGGEPDWRDAFDSALSFGGVSWLWQSDPGTSSVVANFVDAHQDAGAPGAFPVAAMDRAQRGGSLYAATEISGLRLEGEVAVLDEEDEETSFYAQVSRESGELEWRARFEQNSAGYVPIGGAGIISNHRIAEMHARRRFGDRSFLRGRAQFIEENLEGSRPRVESVLLGITYEGRPLADRPALRLRLQADRSEFESADRSVDHRFESYGLELDDRIGPLDLRGLLRRLDTSDQVLATSNRAMTEMGLDVARSFRRGDASFRLAAGINYREQERNADYDAWSPVFNASFQHGAHSLALHLGFMDQDFVPTTIEDLQYRTRRLTYSLTLGSHAFFLEAGQELRRLEPNLDTDSNRVALRYRFSFEREF